MEIVVRVSFTLEGVGVWVIRVWVAPQSISILFNS
jgi:hypothetical protein